MGFVKFKIRRAQLHCIRTALKHYENFFVLGPLTPPRLVPHIASLYAYARYADDLADESDDPKNALHELDVWQQDLKDGLQGDPHHPIILALCNSVQKYQLPDKLLYDLLIAFKQDLSVTRFETFDLVRDYTRRSADPVGRLMLKIYGADDPELSELSDNICTGLQLANFCQDIGEDALRDRIYIPLDECRRFGVDIVDILDRKSSPKLEGLLRFQIVRAYRFLLAGLPLAERLKGRLKISVRLFTLGGLQILEILERDPLAALYRRMKLSPKQKMKAVLTSLRPLSRTYSADSVKPQPVSTQKQ
ncbi:squalene synthase HpnC [candidate division LCP-89 bacterium B3_LCP]|uniref:Squalene synthase HpnC n=1 Tax=candidate division LCP-89 bacterium B3_LCP TaxID=2012998 RepID=A0A532UPV2_UNCL8|nr:MAG: squalene synthase HpnC [candidate division LCP-89 bacterium B3_LCP]